MAAKIICSLLVTLALFQGSTSRVVPKSSEAAFMARYVIHQAEWISISTIATMDKYNGYPMVNVKSVVDGPVNNSTGVPYLLMTDLDFTGKDLNADNRVTGLATLADTLCVAKGWDAQDPRCPRVIITGKVVRVVDSTEEYSFARKALISRHPDMELWFQVHDFYIVKLDIEQIIVLDEFGGAKYVTPAEYYGAKLHNFVDPPQSLLEN